MKGEGMARALEITEALEGGEHVITLVGRLDTNTSHQLEAVAARLFSGERDARVVVDMGRCDYLSSAGIRVIVSMRKRATAGGGTLRFRNVLPAVMDVLTATGIDAILTLE